MQQIVQDQNQLNKAVIYYIHS